VPRVNPFDVTAPSNRVGYSIEAVAHNTINSTHPSRVKNVGNKISGSLGFHFSLLIKGTFVLLTGTTNQWADDTAHFFPGLDDPLALLR
jgi:hypothetical protein